MVNDGVIRGLHECAKMLDAGKAPNRRGTYVSALVTSDQFPFLSLPPLTIPGSPSPCW